LAVTVKLGGVRVFGKAGVVINAYLVGLLRVSIKVGVCPVEGGQRNPLKGAVVPLFAFGILLAAASGARTRRRDAGSARRLVARISAFAFNQLAASPGTAAVAIPHFIVFTALFASWNTNPSADAGTVDVAGPAVSAWLPITVASSPAASAFQTSLSAGAFSVAAVPGLTGRTNCRSAVFGTSQAGFLFAGHAVNVAISVSAIVAVSAGDVINIIFRLAPKIVVAVVIGFVAISRTSSLCCTIHYGSAATGFISAFSHNPNAFTR